MLFLSCNSKGGKQTISNKDNIEIGNTASQELKSITCSLLSLDGEKEIYSINANILTAFGKKYQLSDIEYNKIKQYPSQILEKDEKYGCGVCVDEVDYKFVFNFGKTKTKWEIQPNYDEIPKEIQLYFDLLITKYNEQLK